MHRTQIYLEEKHYQALRSQAHREGTSIAALIRKILDEHLIATPKNDAEDPLEKVIGIGRGDGSRVAENYEDILYGSDS